MLGRTLKFGSVTRDPDVRELDEMRTLLLDKDYAQNASNRPLYYMYRDLYKSEQHQNVMRQHDLRFDITVMTNSPLGREYVKTKGHYHPEARNGVSYPEIYEVMDGKAHYLLQKTDASGNIVDVIVVEANPGDKVIIPPGYGHITINASDEPLKMANWVSTQFASQYGEIVEKQGGAYYETIAGDWIKNKKYDDVPNIRFEQPTQFEELHITPDKNMYSLIESPNKLAFLNRPHKFAWVFEELY